MNFGWLLNIFKGLLKVFSPLKLIKHWKIWHEIWQVYLRFRKWRDWYRDHIQKQIDAFRRLQRQIYNMFFLPILQIIDTLRRISQIVGIFSHKLAAKLNSIFFRIEGAILAPMRAWQNRINSLGNALQAFLTPLGYFDRATLLNSVWRDVRKIRSIFRNPLGGTIAAADLPPGLTILDRVDAVKQYALTGGGPLADRVNARVEATLAVIAEAGG